MGFTERSLGDALGQLYVARHFEGGAKARALEMVERVCEDTFMQLAHAHATLAQRLRNARATLAQRSRNAHATLVTQRLCGIQASAGGSRREARRGRLDGGND